MGDACHPFRLWVGFDEPQCFGFRIRCNRDVVGAGYIGSWKGFGIAAAAHFDGLRMDILG